MKVIAPWLYYADLVYKPPLYSLFLMQIPFVIMIIIIIIIIRAMQMCMWCFQIEAKWLSWFAPGKVRLGSLIPLQKKDKNHKL